MNFDDYQSESDKTANRKHCAERTARLTNFALGLSGEAGEVAELIKKHVFHDQPLDEDKLVRELGDCLWYLAALSSALAVNLSRVAETNIAKLRARYPNGFDAERSTVREGDAR